MPDVDQTLLQGSQTIHTYFFFVIAQQNLTEGLDPSIKGTLLAFCCNQNTYSAHPVDRAHESPDVNSADLSASPSDIPVCLLLVILPHH